MVHIYCGKSPQLPKTYTHFGSQYACLKKGIGIGLHLQNKNLPNPKHSTRRLYCGNKTPIPKGYDGVASPYTCLRKGVGVGLYKQFNLKDKAKIEKYESS